MASILKSNRSRDSVAQETVPPSVDPNVSVPAIESATLRPSHSGISSKISGATIGPSKGVAGLTEFNLSDLAQQGRAEIERCRREAEEMLRLAEEESKKLRTDAKQEGHAEGVKQAIADIEKKISVQAAEKSKQQLASMQATVAAMKQQYEAWMQQYSEVLTQTALAAAEHLTRANLSGLPVLQAGQDNATDNQSNKTVDQEQLADQEQLLVRWAKEALHSTRSAGRLTLVVHPDTLAEIGGQLDELLADPGLPEQSSVIADETVGRHDVVVRQDGGQIAAGLEAQLARLREELS